MATIRRRHTRLLISQACAIAWVCSLACSDVPSSGVSDQTIMTSGGTSPGASAGMGAGGTMMGATTGAGFAGATSAAGSGMGGSPMAPTGAMAGSGGMGMSGGGSGGAFPQAGMGASGAPMAAGAAGTSMGGGAGMGSGGTDMGGAGLGGSGGSGGETAAPSGFCPTDGSPCKILPFGDSITDGVGGPQGGGGYRIPLFSLTLDAGQNITFVGGAMNGPNDVDGTPFPRRHAGYSGYTIAQIGPGTGPWDGAFEDPPHIILLHIGTNDMYGQDPGGAPGRLESLLDSIIEEVPDSLLVVAMIIPLGGGFGNVDSYNTELVAAVEERIDAGHNIVLVDQNSDFPLSELPDNVHPNAAGYSRMADVWYAAISEHLN